MVLKLHRMQRKRGMLIRISRTKYRWAAVAVAAAACLFTAAVSPATASNIWAQLRDEPGVVVLMRHAIAPGGGDPPGFTLGDCSTQRNLSAQGRAQARAIGAQFTRRQIPVAGVRTSRWCRAEQTARLLGLGPVQRSAALDSVFTAPRAAAAIRQRQAERIIRAHRGKPGALILVGHQANIIDLTGIAPASGEAVVVRAEPNGSIRVLGRIPAP